MRVLTRQQIPLGVQVDASYLEQSHKLTQHGSHGTLHRGVAAREILFGGVLGG